MSGIFFNMGVFLSLLLSVVSFADSFVSVDVELFYEEGCEECNEVKQQVLSELDARFKGLYSLTRHDLALEDEFRRLMRYQTTLNDWDNESVYVVVAGRVIFSGAKEIKKNLIAYLEHQISISLNTTNSGSNIVVELNGIISL